VRALAKAIGYPRWKITRYAVQAGLVPKQKKEPDWSQREIHILELNARWCPDVVQRKLKRAGFLRSVTGIVLKRKRLRLPGNLEGMSSRQLALCLGVDDHFVTRAIQGGRLKGERRGTLRTEKQGGDMWFIKRKDIRAYIMSWLNEIDIRKVSKYWFVDLLISKD
jgi:hypothetical protein